MYSTPSNAPLLSNLQTTFQFGEWLGKSWRMILCQRLRSCTHTRSFPSRGMETRCASPEREQTASIVHFWCCADNRGEHDERKPGASCERRGASVHVFGALGGERTLPFIRLPHLTPPGLRQTSEIPFDDRFNKYLDNNFFEHQIHWFSIFNSFMMVVFLVGLVAMIMLRTLRRDFAKYARDEEDDFVSPCRGRYSQPLKNLVLGCQYWG